jgi:membrane-associated protein
MRLYSTLASLGLDPEKLIRSFGTIGLFAIIFAESGIMIGFFLPGDSLLFAAGLLSAKGTLPNIAIISIGCAIAAVAGDQVGYSFGNKVGPSLFKRPDSRFFKQEYLGKAEEFFEHYGSKAIILARFVPIVRTFTPIVAGASSMHYRTFLRNNVIGGVVWAVAFTQLGYWLGKRYPWMVDKIEIFAIVIVAFSLIPVAIEFVRHRRRSARATAAAAPDDSAV